MRLREEQAFIPEDTALYPGGGREMSDWGFIAPGEKLAAVLKRDQKALEILGYSSEEVAECLSPLLQIAAEYMPQRMSLPINHSYQLVMPNGRMVVVQVERYIGGQPCPWRDKLSRDWEGAVDFFVIDHDEYEKARKGKDWSSFYFDSKMEGDYRVGMQELGYRGLTKIPCLIYHLIREHGFFE